MRIREATPADTAVIAEFNRRLAAETEGRPLDLRRVRRGVAALLTEPAKGVYFVAEAGVRGERQIVGQLLITMEWSDWRCGNFWWIQSVFVLPEHRRQGVFTALCRHVERLARRRGSGVCGLRLYMHHANHRARRVYQRLGLAATDYVLFERDFVGQAGAVPPGAAPR